MKKALMILAAGGMFALGAQADSSETFTVQGDVPVVCQANNNSVADPEIIDLTSSASQTLGSFTYVCNSAAGFVRTISSASGGSLVNGSQSIPYTVSHGGGSGLGFSATALTTPKVTNLGGSTAFIAGQTGGFSVQVSGSTSGLFAGTYADDITLAVTAN
ncbi:MAG: hypothetical protein RLO80_07340 [Hyphomonas sp.]